MPYVSLERPSVALGTLAATLDRAGISCATVYGNLIFAERIGMLGYEWLNNSDITLQMGEWTFSEAAFGRSIRPAEEYVEALFGAGGPHAGLLDSLLQVRAFARVFIDDLAAMIVARQPRLVGCSSVFQQQCASLALLRRIRELDPAIVTMLGGANCEGSMGVVVHQQYPWVDFVVSGEADKLLPGLCSQVLEHGREVPAEQIPFGVLAPVTRSAGVAANAPRAIVKDLDEIPIPNFDDYFAQLERSPLRSLIIPCIPMETSRGCWWGAKNHCTFCGLNGEGMTFRAKSQDRVEHEVRWLSARHGLKRFMTVDNILDHRYFTKVLPAMVEMGDLRVFYETKANLSRPQVEMLSQAGVRWIQPGIEALHDGLLSLLKKGCSLAVNVQLLKWASRYGVWVIWNHLYAAPGDRPEWYDEVADVLPLIMHLQPPTGGVITRIRYDRFSPYFNDAQAFGLKLVPYWAYAHVYPLDERQLMDQVYFFCHDGPLSPAPARLEKRVVEWAKSFYAPRSSPTMMPRRSDDAPVLAMADDGERIVIRDTRPCAVAPRHQLDELESRLCRVCDAAKSGPALLEALRRAGAPETEAEIMAALHGLIEKKIVADFNGRFLCLAVDDDPIPYLRFEEYAAGLALLSPPPAKRTPKRDVDPAVYVDPWETPVHEMF
jgi:magnesium-protoporphyrin IX monomethyl ester (oxidative) cyclase